jgi:eukaryotic-like serine/threonine-protein kinase
MALTLGTKLGPYEIESPLGAGGMGEVYRAKDTRLDRTVAIKILPAHLSSDPVRKQRFEREAKAISSLNHPHICVLYDVGSQNGIDYLVMECVEGETLAKRLERGALPLEQVLKYGMQIAGALDKAHRSGIIHRDLKPGNIMLTPPGAKLLDFGLAKETAALSTAATLTATRNSPVTEQGTIVGTFCYMSPEQVEGKELDGRSDIFSFGAVLYEMLTGQRAFEGKSQLSVASAILEKEPAPISSVKPMSPPSLDRVVKICLAKDPDDRWHSVHDVELQLRWIAEGGSQAGIAASARARWTLAQFAGWAVAAICFLASFALAAVIFLRAPQPAPAMRSSLLPPQGSAYEPYNFAISPDGTRLAFVALGADGQDTLWVRSLSSSRAQQISGTEQASFPFWSPDSRSIGFFTDSKLKTVDITSSTVKVLADAPGGRGGTWNSKGTILFAPEIFGQLLTVSERGGAATPRRIVAPAYDMFQYDVAPDGHFLINSLPADLSSPLTLVVNWPAALKK